MDWYIGCWKKYVDFSGRARRTEYWMFSLLTTLASFGFAFLDGIIGSPFLLCNLYGLAAMLPNLAVTVRRLHDTDRSGWWVLITLIPLVGSIVFLVFMCLDSTPGDNRFGPNPKAAC